MVGGPIVVRHRSFGPAHRTLAPKVRSARPGFAAPARPGLRLGRVESLVRATVVSVPPDREPGASRREPRSARRAFSRKPRSTTAVCDRNFDRTPRFPTANFGRPTETSVEHRYFQPQLRSQRLQPLLAFVLSEALGSRPAPGTPCGKRSVGTRRAASMQDTLFEGTARAAQLAPSAVTASAVGGSATSRGVVGRVSPTTSGSSRSTCDRAAWKSRLAHHKCEQQA